MRGGYRKGSGRKKIDPSKKRITRAVAINEAAWEKICAKAESKDCSTNDIIEAWALRLKSDDR